MAELAPLHPALQALVGQVLAGRYRIDAVLGRGGMGAVFRAQHLGLGRDVAVKILHPELTSDELQLRRFEREARAASRLDHPNCIRVTDFGVTDANVTYLVMDLLVGADLRTKLGVPLPIPRVLDYGLQIARGLAHAHGHGLVHRDLKPENVIVVRGEAGEELKLVDFGIAKVLDGEGANDKLTRTGFAFGTPRYMSPEQATGGKIDEGADLYALGLLLYEMCTALPPFEADDSVSLLRKHVYESPPALPTRVPPALAQIIVQLLAKVRAQRPASAHAVVEALSEAIAFPAGRFAPTTGPGGAPTVAGLSAPAPVVAGRPVASAATFAEPTPRSSSDFGTAPTMAHGASVHAPVSGPSGAVTATASRPSTTQSARTPRDPVLVPMVMTIAGVVILIALVTAFMAVRCVAAAPENDEIAPSAAGLVAGTGCAEQERLAGRWRFTTTVVAARLPSTVGVNGRYDLDVDVKDCTARASLRKLGYDDVTFDDDRVQIGEGDLGAPPGWLPLGLAGSFRLTNQRGDTLEQELVLVAVDDELFGYWRHRGAEWDRASMSGSLRGHREGREPSPSGGAQPCAVQCAIACDAGRRETDGALANESVTACMQACEARPAERVVCGDVRPLPAELALPVVGPYRNFDALCSALAERKLRDFEGNSDGRLQYKCSADLRVDGKKPKKLDERQLGGAWRQAFIVDAGFYYGAYDGGARLALETDAGWYATDPIVDLSAGNASNLPTMLGLYAHDIAGAGQTGVVALVGHRFTDTDYDEESITEQARLVGCRLDGDEPKCAAVLTQWRDAVIPRTGGVRSPGASARGRDRSGQIYAAFLPDGVVSIAPPGPLSRPLIYRTPNA